MLPRKVQFSLSFYLIIFMSFTSQTVAGERRATATEAQDLVAHAIEFYDANGQEQAFIAFNEGSNGFIDHDLYIFVFGPQRTIVSHGGDQKLIGTQAETLIDVDGIPFGDLFMDESTDEGLWIKYKWSDPVSGEVMDKKSWVVLHKGYVFGAGSYSDY